MLLKQNVNDREQAVRNGDQGSLFATFAGQALVLSVEVGFLAV